MSSLLREYISESIMYHATDPANVNSIQQSGLEVGRESAHTMGGAWADEYYGTRPVYVSVQKGKYEGTPFEIDTAGLAVVADLPSLVDTGAYQEEEGMYWDEGSEPQQMQDIVDEDVVIEQKANRRRQKRKKVNALVATCFNIIHKYVNIE